jgi:hypothetical protein
VSTDTFAFVGAKILNCQIRILREFSVLVVI